MATGLAHREHYRDLRLIPASSPAIHGGEWDEIRQGHGSTGEILVRRDG